MLSDATLAETLAEMQQLYGADQGMASYRQELFCDWTASVLGSFYALEMAAVRAEGRVAEIEPIAGQPVHRAWDLGIGDDTSVWKFQVVGSQIFILSHKATSGVSVEWWRDELAAEDAERGWKTGTDWVPHDAKHREFGTGRTIIETMRALNLRPMPVPSVPVQDGINAVRRTLPFCVFHPRCEEGGLSALEQYKREWDDEKKAFRAICRTRLDEPSCGCVSLSGALLARGQGARDRAAAADRDRDPAAAREPRGDAAVSVVRT